MLSILEANFKDYITRTELITHRMKLILLNSTQWSFAIDF